MANDITKYERPSLTADCVVFTMRRYDSDENCKNVLQVRLVKRSREPEEGKWALPGAFVPIDRRIEDVMRSAAAKKAGLTYPFYAEQLQTFDSPGRDERWRVVSVAYLGIYPMSADVSTSNEESQWFTIDMSERTLHQPLLNITISFDELAFDHAAILDTALDRLLAKSSYSDIALRFLDEHFTIAEIKTVMEGLTGKTFNNVKRSFESVIEKTELEGDSDSPKPAHRPASYYRRKASDNETAYKTVKQAKERTL